ncbi:MAG: NADPH:quinone oxidoreductase family protein [Acidimicrobiia bacterium]|nr:NADPH:quinone oxidoreductase family protein [Acidimicrobiia bacterium]
MRAIVCTELGPASQLSVMEVDDPVAAAGEVVVDVVAAGLNFPDTLIIEGRYQFKPDLPFVPGGEAAGVISAVGDGVGHLSVGQRVIALSTYGAFAEKWAVPATGVIPIPDALDFESAAGFGLTYGTSYHALVQRARLQPSEKLLVLGAAGGVGSAAIEIGKHLGAEVIAAASTTEKLAFAADLGADHLVDYTTENLRDRIKEITGGSGVDVVYDPVGGDLTEQAFRSLAWNGRHLVVGFAAGEIPELPVNLALLKGASLVGVFWGRSLSEEPRRASQNFVELTELANAGVIHPRVSQRFTLDRYEEAFAVFEGRSVMGKAIFVTE